MSSFQIFLRALLFACLNGIFWIAYSKLYLLPIPFAVTGVLVAVWFLPIAVSAQMQKNSHRYLPGLLLLTETTAAAISAAFGDLGGISLQFGLAQGLAAEAGFALRRSLASAVWSALLADIVLMSLHPQTAATGRFLSVEGGVHLIGAFLSVAICLSATRRVFRRRMAIVFFVLLSASVEAVPCYQTLLPEIGTGELVVAVDYDSTIVDTDRFLVEQVLPNTVLKLWADVSDVPKPFQEFLDRLKVEGTAYYPASYEESAWRCSRFGFPVDHLPGDLRGFWEAMSKVFKGLEPTGSDLKTLPIFEEFRQTLTDRYGERIHWVVCTARTRPMTSSLSGDLAQRGLRSAHILHAGNVRGRDSAGNAERKARQLHAYRTAQGQRPQLFLDNDPVNVAAVANTFNGNLLALLLRKNESSSRLEIEPWHAR